MILGPRAMEFLDPGLDQFPFGVAKVCIPKSGLFAESVPVVGDDTSVSEVCSEGTSGGSWVFPAALGLIRGDIRTWVLGSDFWEFDRIESGFDGNIEGIL